MTRPQGQAKSRERHPQEEWQVVAVSRVGVVLLGSASCWLARSRRALPIVLLQMPGMGIAA